MLNATLGELSAALAARKVSSVELTRLFLERIGRLNGELNAFITVDEARSLEQARRADERRAQGGAGPLTGIPVAHKDIFCTKGMATTCGSRMLANFASPYDARVIENFDAEGAVLLGKCNMDEFAMGSSNETSHFGPVRNPWDRRLVPGGGVAEVNGYVVGVLAQGGLACCIGADGAADEHAVGDHRDIAAVGGSGDSAGVFTDKAEACACGGYRRGGHGPTSGEYAPTEHATADDDDHHHDDAESRRVHDTARRDASHDFLCGRLT